MTLAGISFRIIPPYSPEQDNLLPLLADCFPEHWGKRPPGSPFPYAGTSFVAIADNEFIGHLATMKIEISTGAGDIVSAGGVASVAVAHAFRGHGIAEQLCRMSQEYFKKRNYALMMLYTSLYRVYEKSGWQRYNNSISPWSLTSVPKKTGNPQPVVAGVPAAKTSQEMQNLIMMANINAPSFPGKVHRYEGEKVKHSWKWFFNRKDLLLYFSQNGYAVVNNGILEELYAPQEDVAGILNSVLAENPGGVTVSASQQQLTISKAEKLGFSTSSRPLHDPMDGESPMIYQFNTAASAEIDKAIKEKEFFFSSIDKF